jgi:hypothetical protein
MSKDVDTSTPNPAPSNREPIPTSLIRLIRATVVAIGALYVATHSIVVTLICSAVVILLVALFLRSR